MYRKYALPAGSTSSRPNDRTVPAESTRHRSVPADETRSNVTAKVRPRESRLWPSATTSPFDVEATQSPTNVPETGATVVRQRSAPSMVYEVTASRRPPAGPEITVTLPAASTAMRLACPAPPLPASAPPAVHRTGGVVAATAVPSVTSSANSSVPILRAIA